MELSNEPSKDDDDVVIDVTDPAAPAVSRPASLPDPEPVDLTVTPGGPSSGKRIVPAAGLLAIVILIVRAMRKRS